VNLQLLTIPIAAILVVVSLVLIIKFVASRYIKVGPDEIAVFSGRKYKYKAPDGSVQTRGFLILQGGGRVLLPIVEKVMIIKISAFQVEVGEGNIPNKDNVGVTVKGIASCRLSLAEEDLANAVTNFLDKSDQERTHFIQNILKGHVRSIVGNLDMEQLLRERSKLNEQVVKESTSECKRIGIEIITLVIQDIRDEHGYIEALGKQKIAMTMRDANVATAEAERDTVVKVSGAKREAAEAEATNMVKIAEAEKNRDVRVAEFKQETEGKRAAAEAAFSIAQAAQQKTLQVAEAERDSAAKQAQAKVQELEAVRREKELNATLIKQAEADQRAAIIKAEADKRVATLVAETAAVHAEGEKNAAIQAGQGEAERKRIIAEAEAEATRKTLTAAADGEKAKLLAEAEGNRAKLLAEAEGLRSSKLAEAEGTDKMAEALKKMSEQGQLILILDRLPNLLAQGGDAGAKIAEAIFGPMGKSLEKIGPITITDFGGGHATKNGLSNIGGIIPQIVLDLFSQAKARGLDVGPLLKGLKIDPAHLDDLLTPKPPIPVASTPVRAEESLPAGTRR
jgi:flotillin